jgi:putative phage-type endonuclease
MDSFLQNKEKIDIQTFTIKKSVKKTKMNKETKLNIQRVIHDIILDGSLSEEEMLDPGQEIKDLIFNLVLTVESKKTISCEEEEEIKNSISYHLKKSVKVIPPTYNKDEISNLKDIIFNLKQIPQPEQRTKEWYEFRGNRLTASDLGSVIGTNPYENYLNTVLKKCGIEVPFTTNKAIKHGIKYEEIVTMIYSFRNNLEVFEYGCIPHPTIPHFGASPDGIVDSKSKNTDMIGRMLEIKCPTGRPITGFCPEYYWAQVQGQLDVCDLDYCDFVECLIQEYSSEDEYFMDEGINDVYNSLGMEKGVIVDAYDLKLGKEVFYYCELGKSKGEIEKWESHIIDRIISDDNLEYQRTSYWRLVKYNALLIKRDKEWWDGEALPKINKYWSDVLEHRKMPLEEIQKLFKPRSWKKPVKQQPKIDKFIETKKKPSNGFLTDSDED